ncbi:hypothetical protein [Pseudoalteromonas sp. S558]|uniref:hypothetical protein n=1 Tax=Pseudoalteromonas sp. S558 TaxID=2066515 RepID=UPI00110AA5A8|nr:hypothetical protein [Pseudoalteromonas sp. S558]TMO03135.1 hypothetical protein CWB66_11640 [Pseudoalteromonas sp. S558]
MNSYKYFLIYDRNNKIIYGECIYWCCGEFDSVKQSDVTIRLKKKFKARFIVSNTRLDSIIDQQKIIKIGDGILLHYENSYDDFVTQRSDEAVFNPLIDRCCKLNMFVGRELDSKTYLSWVDEHKYLLEEIKTRFELDLLKRPELINSYTYYEPTRIVVNCRFIDKPAPRENRLPTKLIVKFYDEFTAYTQASYVLTGYCEGKEPAITEGKIANNEITIDFEESPDELEIKILNHGEVIYNSRHGFLRNIHINGRVIGDSVTLDNGSKVSKYSEMKTSV